MKHRVCTCTHVTCPPSMSVRSDGRAPCVGRDAGDGGRCIRRNRRGWACYGGNSFPGLVAYWVEVITAAALWAAEGGVQVSPVVDWLALVLLWREGRAGLGELVEAAHACRAVAAWRLAAAVRVGTRACWRWDRLRGRVSLRDPAPFPASWDVPSGFGLAVLVESAEPFGLDESDARAEWAEACQRHGVEALSC